MNFEYIKWRNINGALIYTSGHYINESEEAITIMEAERPTEIGCGIVDIPKNAIVERITQYIDGKNIPSPKKSTLTIDL